MRAFHTPRLVGASVPSLLMVLALTSSVLPAPVLPAPVLPAHPDTVRGVASCSSAGVVDSGQTQLIIISGASGAIPQTITVTVGMAVQWKNNDDIDHTVTSDDGCFTAPVPAQGKSMQRLLLPAGRYPYHIDKLPQYPTGTIVVLGDTSSPTSAPSYTASPNAIATSTAVATTNPTPVATGTGTTPPTILATSTTSPSAMASATLTPTATPTTNSAASATASVTVSPTSTSGVPVDTTLITITNTGFQPPRTSIYVGAAVAWTNLQTMPVTVASTDGAISYTVGPIAPGTTSAPQSFDRTGQFGYTLQSNGNFTGAIVVIAAPTPTSAPSVNPTSTMAIATTTPTASATATPAASDTIIPAASSTASTVATALTASATPTITPTSTPTAIAPTAAPTATPTAIPMATATATDNPVSMTPTTAATTPAAATATPSAVPSSPTPAPAGATPTVTATAIATPTGTTVATATPTGTTVATATPTGTTVATTMPTATVEAPTNTVAVTIAPDGRFDPQGVTVTSGMYVQWLNLASVPVTVTDPGVFSIGPIAPATTGRQLFVAPGSYPYMLAGTDGVTGVVTVVTPGPALTSSPSGTPLPLPSASLPASTASATATGTSGPAGLPSPTPIRPSPSSSPTSTTTEPATNIDPTATASSTATASPTATATATATPLSTVTRVPTSTSTSTPIPTATPTSTPTPSPTPTETPTSQPPPDTATIPAPLVAAAAGTAATVPPTSSGAAPTEVTATSATTTASSPTPSGSATLPTTTGRLPQASSSPPSRRATVAPSQHGRGATSHTTPRRSSPAAPVSINVRGSGYLRRGRDRVALSFVISSDHGRATDALHLNDPARRLMLILPLPRQARSVANGVSIGGTARVGRRAVPFVLVVTMTRHGRTLVSSIVLAIPALRYHVASIFHGRLDLHTRIHIAAPRPIARPHRQPPPARRSHLHVRVKPLHPQGP